MVWYRFGFNGQMKDDEVYGDGNSYTAEYWQYDPRIGRRWNVDPMTGSFPWQSPYAAFDGNPIVMSDPRGLAAEDETDPPGGGEQSSSTKASASPASAASAAALSKRVGATGQGTISEYKPGLVGQIKNTLTSGDIPHPTALFLGPATGPVSATLWKADVDIVESLWTVGTKLLFDNDTRLDGTTVQGAPERQRALETAAPVIAGAVGGAMVGQMMAEARTLQTVGTAADVAMEANTELKAFSGTEKAWQSGATPNSNYTYLSSDGKAVSNYIYDAEGKVIFQVDFGRHGRFPSGHGHSMTIPGNLGSGHNSHIPLEQITPEYLRIPNGVEYSVPLGL